MSQAGAYEKIMFYEANKANTGKDGEDNKEKRREKENQKKKERKKGDAGNRELRAKQIEFIKQDEKWILQWNGTPFDDFIGPGTPKLTEGIREGTFRLEPVDVVPKKKIQFYKIPLIDGFGNICECNGLYYSKKVFIGHIKSAHRRYIPPLSQINRPRQIIWVVFYDDDTELLFCQTDQDLT